MQTTMTRGAQTLVVAEVGEGMVRAEVSRTSPSGEVTTKPSDFPNTTLQDVVNRYLAQGWVVKKDWDEPFLGKTDFVWF